MRSKVPNKGGLPAKPVKSLLLGAVFLSAIVFSGVLENSFVNYDDHGYIHENPYLENFSIKEIFTTFYAANYHPLTTLTYAIEFSRFGTEPRPYHALNLALHLLNVGLVFLFIFALTKRNDAAFIVALLFGIHPMHVESVAWIAERKDVLYTLFFVASLTCYVHYIRTQARRYLLWSGGLFLLSCLSKSAAITLPLVLLLLDWYLDRDLKSRRVLLEKLPFFAVSILFGTLALLSQSATGAINPLKDFGIFEKVLLSSYALLFYLVKSILPLHQAVVHFYPDRVDDSLPFWYYAAPILLAALGFIVWKTRSIRSELCFGLGFFFLNLVLVIHIISLGPAVAAERYTYVPYIGLFFLVGLFYVEAIDRRPSSRSLLIVVLSIWCLGLGYQSWKRIKVWKNGETLFTDLVEQYPDEGLGYFNLADFKSSRGEHGATIEFLNRAIELQSHYPHAFNQRGMAKRQLGDLEGAIADYGEALKLDSNLAAAYNNRANARAMLKDYAAAIPDFDRAIELNPENAGAFANRGNAYLMLEDCSRAVADYDKALAADPANQTVRINRGVCKVFLGERAEGCADLQLAASQGAQQAQAHLQTYCH